MQRLHYVAEIEHFVELPFGFLQALQIKLFFLGHFAAKTRLEKGIEVKVGLFGGLCNRIAIFIHTVNDVVDVLFRDFPFLEVLL